LWEFGLERLKIRAPRRKETIQRNMKTLLLARLLPAWAATLAAVAALVLPPVHAAGGALTENPSILEPIATRWLADWDAGNWEVCWNAFSPQIQGNSRLDKWTVRETNLRYDLGKAISRKFVQIDGTLFPGDVVVIVEFDTTFEHKGVMSEGVFLKQEPNGSWSIAAHVIKAPDEHWPRDWRIVP
jgi:hypothetical protein